MATTLTAVPVGQGDAFLLQRGDGSSVLVDGGRARLGFSHQLPAYLRKSRIDVAICTHADADHADGLRGLLESWAAPIREVWLPGRWTERLVQLCQEPEAFLEELTLDVLTAESTELESFDADVDEAVLEDIDLAVVGEGRLESISEALSLTGPHLPDVLDAAATPFPWGLWPKLWLDAPSPPSRRTRHEVWLKAVQTAARIRDIARLAWHAGARIRWFDFSEAKNSGVCSGGEPHLEPLNSVELTHRYVTHDLTALRYIGLSLANRESLVFRGESSDSRASVLFAADSDLKSAQLAPCFRADLLVTAPHHGSDANAAAYRAIGLATSTPHWWVRSDGNYKTRPGAHYLALGQRSCTFCRGSTDPKQAVKFTDTGTGWTLDSGVRSCQCR